MLHWHERKEKTSIRKIIHTKAIYKKKLLTILLGQFVSLKIVSIFEK